MTTKKLKALNKCCKFMWGIFFFLSFRTYEAIFLTSVLKAHVKE